MSAIDDLIAKGYSGYAGWGETEALADYKATGGSGKYTGGSGGGQSSPSGVSNFNDYVTQAQNMYKPAIEPAVQSLQASVPEIKSSTYSTMLDMIEEKYIEPKDFDFNSLILSIKEGKTNYIDLTELQSVYLGMKYDQYRVNYKDNDWDP
jgi:hypothetical protein